MQPITIMLAITFLVLAITFDYFFIAPRRWMKKYGSGNYHGDRSKPLNWFVRQYKHYQLLESYGENPKGRDKS